MNNIIIIEFRCVNLMENCREKRIVSNIWDNIDDIYES